MSRRIGLCFGINRCTERLDGASSDAHTGWTLAACSADLVPQALAGAIPSPACRPGRER